MCGLPFFEFRVVLRPGANAICVTSTAQHGLPARVTVDAKEGSGLTHALSLKSRIAAPALRRIRVRPTGHRQALRIAAAWRAARGGSARALRCTRARRPGLGPARADCRVRCPSRASLGLPRRSARAARGRLEGSCPSPVRVSERRTGSKCSA